MVLNSFLVYLDLGRIEVRVASGERQRTLTSSQTYNNGALHAINIDLEGSRLVLKTVKEVVKRGLQRVPVSSLANYSELFMGGVGPRVREEADIQQSNFTGCVSAFSLSSMLKAPKCFEHDFVECSYCSNHEVNSHRQFLLWWNFYIKLTGCFLGWFLWRKLCSISWVYCDRVPRHLLQL